MPQIYVASAAGGWEAPKRLAGWRKVNLEPGASTAIEVRVDPRLLGMFNAQDNAWHIASGTYRVMAGGSSADLPLETRTELPDRKLPAGYRP